MATDESTHSLPQVEVAVSPTEKFREYLATQGMRLTPERRMIVEEVFSSHEHFDADELVHRVHRSSGVSRSTAYRTLTVMKEAGLLRKVARAEGRDVYEHDYGYPQHDHLICRECGSLTEFSSDAIAKTVEEVAAAHGFRKSGHRLEVYGTCAECCRPEKRRPSKLDML